MLLITSHDETKGSRTCTLLELVQAVTLGTASDQECVAVITALLRTGRAVLSGNFAGEKLD